MQAVSAEEETTPMEPVVEQAQAEETAEEPTASQESDQEEDTKEKGYLRPTTRVERKDWRSRYEHMGDTNWYVANSLTGT